MINVAMNRKAIGESLISINGLNTQGKLLYDFIKESDKIFMNITINDELVNKEFMMTILEGKPLDKFVGGKRTRLLAEILTNYFKGLSEENITIKEFSDTFLIDIFKSIELVLRDEDNINSAIRDLEMKNKQK